MSKEDEFKSELEISQNLKVCIHLVNKQKFDKVLQQRRRICLAIKQSRICLAIKQRRICLAIKQRRICLAIKQRRICLAIKQRQFNNIAKLF